MFEIDYHGSGVVNSLHCCSLSIYVDIIDIYLSPDGGRKKKQVRKKKIVDERMIEGVYIEESGKFLKSYIIVGERNINMHQGGKRFGLWGLWRVNDLYVVHYHDTSFN